MNKIKKIRKKIYSFADVVIIYLNNSSSFLLKSLTRVMYLMASHLSCYTFSLGVWSTTTLDPHIHQDFIYILSLSLPCEL